jgi:hypothetical protein
MAFQEVTNPGLINAGDSSPLRNIVTNPDGLPPAANLNQAQLPVGTIPSISTFPTPTNPPQNQLPSVGAPANVNIK